MKKALAILSLLALAAVMAATSTAPPACGQGYRKNEACAPKTTIAVYAAGTTVRMKWTIAATPSDSLTVDLSATGQASAHRMYVVDSKTDSIDYAKPAPGASINLSLLAKNCRLGKCVAAPLFTQPYVEPDTVVVPPSVTVQVIPTSATISTTDSLILTARVS